MKQVTEDQFEIVSDVNVIHRPTGTHISTYRYKDPNGGGNLMVRSGLDNDEYSSYDIRSVALTILRRLAEERGESE